VAGDEEFLSQVRVSHQSDDFNSLSTRILNVTAQRPLFIITTNEKISYLLEFRRVTGGHQRGR
jgi:hypothetical protein